MAFRTMDAAEFLAHREAIGTQQEVADAMETARRSLVRWESGARKVPGSVAVLIRKLRAEADWRREHTLAAVKQMGANNG